MDYQKHYDLLINRAKNRVLTEYSERHHIIPECMGGSNDEYNKVTLTAPEHYIAHQLLAKIYPKNDDLIFGAFKMTIVSKGQEQRSKNKLFGWLRKAMSEAVSRSQKGKSKPKLGMYNKKRKGKSYEQIYGLKRAEELKEGKRKSSKRSLEERVGKEKADQLKKQSSEKRTGQKQKLSTCPHCNITGGCQTMKRWHFDNCKSKKISS